MENQLSHFNILVGAKFLLEGSLLLSCCEDV
jgi:hypothetical protein